MVGRYDLRNNLNDLTGTEWLKLTSSYWTTEKCSDDKSAMAHPAPFLIKDIEKLISMFTKKDMIVLDPFCGSGTTLISAFNLHRKGIGIDLNHEYKNLAQERLMKKAAVEGIDYDYIVGDSLDIVKTISKVDYVVTSPPYHNILSNNGKATREDKSKKGHRNGGRLGVKTYSNFQNDLGNQKEYSDFIKLLQKILQECFYVLKVKGYCTIVISDFTVNKKEICVQRDIIYLMEDIGFEFCGTTVLLQPNKPLYPFGYPYAYKINHHHQNMMTFRK